MSYCNRNAIFSSSMGRDKKKIDDKTMKKMKRDYRRGFVIRDLEKKYPPYRRSTIHNILRNIRRPSDEEKKQRIVRLREIEAEWNVSRPSARKIYDIEVFIEKNPEYEVILDRLRKKELSFKVAHAFIKFNEEDFKNR
jgi:hypothetical protein